MRSLTFAGLAFCFLVLGVGACSETFAPSEGASGGGAGDQGSGATGSGGGSGGSGSPGVGGGNVGGAPGSVLPRDGLLLWLRADMGIVNQGGIVSVWEDQSGNDLDAAQPSADNAPELTTLADGDRPALGFNGTSSFLHLPEGFGEFSEGLTFFAVLAQKPPAGCGSFLEFSNGDEIDDIALGFWEDKYLFEVDALYAHPPTALILDEAEVVTAVLNETGASVRLNGTMIGTAEVGYPVMKSRTSNYIGYSSYSSCSRFQGAISEIIIYDRPLSSSELSAVEKDLKDRWL